MTVIVKRSRPLRLEVELLSPVRQWLARDGFVTVAEFPTPWGISDLLGVKPDMQRTMDRIRDGQLDSVGDLHSVMVFLEIPTFASRRSVAFDELKHTLEYALSESKLSSTLERLRKKGFVALNSLGSFSRTATWLPYHEQIVSVELKLSRVEEALAQAKRHRVITPHSFVALPSAAAERVAASARQVAFHEAGVGLISVSGSACTVLINPRKENGDYERAFEIAAGERCWNQVLKTIQH